MEGFLRAGAILTVRLDTGPHRYRFEWG
jgi:hypothetical protein